MATPEQQGKGPGRLSLRLRLTLYLASVALVTQVVVGVIVLYFQSAAIDGLFNSRIAARADTMLAQLRPGGAALTDERLSEMLRVSPRMNFLDRIEAVVYGPDGSAIVSSVRPAPPMNRVVPAPASQMREYRTSIAGVFGGPEEKATARAAIRRIGGEANGLFVLIANDGDFELVTAVMRRVMVVGLAIGMVTWAIAAWLIAGLAMNPIRDLRRVAASFSPESIERDVEFVPSTSPEVAALEQDLRESRARLRSALHAQDRFISNVSHELNTPIAVLLTEAQTLRCDDLSPEAKAFAASVTEEMRRLGRMVGSFLALTRIRGGQKLAALEPCPVNEMVMDAVQACSATAQQRRVTLTPRLTLEDPSLSVRGDPSLLQVMIDNLLRNAVRHSPIGRPVIVSVVREGNECVVRVQDAGPAVPEQELGSMFDQFSEVPRRGGERGFGLGLAVAQGVAELHGGQIQAENLPAGGCEFTARLPLAPATAPVKPDACVA